jgi:putative PIG3 family NAD(P)H quinone oxidoreductase
MSGEVIDPNGSKWKKGSRVMALLGGGGYAEKVSVHKDMLLPVPENVSTEQAAGISEVFYTAFVNLFLEAGLEKGESVLIHAGGSGVGTAAIQLAKHKGCVIFVTAGSDEKIVNCKNLGATEGINYHRESFSSKILNLNNGKGVNVILDCVGGKYLSENLSLIAKQGRIVQIAAMGGAKTEIDLGMVLQKRVRLIGSTLRGRSIEEIKITEKFRREVLPLFGSNAIGSIVDSVYPIHQAEEAHRYISENKNFGKVILRII